MDDTPDTYDCGPWFDWPKKGTRPGRAWKAVYRYAETRAGMTVEEAVSALGRAAEGLTAPVIEGSRVAGWVPMTPQEKAAAERRAAGAAKARAKRVERERAADLAKIAALAKKHGLTTLPTKEG